MNRLETLATIKGLSLPEGEYLVMGGSCMAVWDVRQSPDVDLYVSQELFDELHAKGWPIDEEFKTKWRRERLVRKPFEVFKDFHILKDGTYIPF
ncbi:MAG TPA: hypothetical protein VGP13_02755, partial [Candidatus Paceibacterota bacterium]|nr:hypothetical protein [Candidatus Paceibacterota bacterium]